MTTPPTPAGWYPDPEQSGGAPVLGRRSLDRPSVPCASASRACRPRTSRRPAALPREPAQRPWLHRTAWAPDRAPGPPRARHRAADGAGPAARAGTPSRPPTRRPCRPYRAADDEDAVSRAGRRTRTPPHRRRPSHRPSSHRPDTEPPAPVDNSKLVMWFGGAVAALLLVWVLVAVYVFVIHKNDTVQISAPTTTKPSATTTEKETTTSAEATATESPTHRRRWPPTAR